LWLIPRFDCPQLAEAWREEAEMPTPGPTVACLVGCHCSQRCSGGKAVRNRSRIWLQIVKGEIIFQTIDREALRGLVLNLMKTTIVHNTILKAKQ
jgi:hypothetical protein